MTSRKVAYDQYKATCAALNVCIAKNWNDEGSSTAYFERITAELCEKYGYEWVDVEDEVEVKGEVEDDLIDLVMSNDDLIYKIRADLAASHYDYRRVKGVVDTNRSYLKDINIMMKDVELLLSNVS